MNKNSNLSARGGLSRFIDKIMNLFLIICGVALLWILLLVTCIASFKIPSDSMEPTLLAGDNILVNKCVMGGRLFNIWDALEDKEINISRLPGLGKVKRNDVLVFNFPYSGGWDRISMHLSRFYVKRCIGIPGDSLQIKGGFYEINGRRGIGNLNDQEMLSNYRGEYPQGIYNTYPFDYRLGWNFINFGPLYLPRKGDTLPIDTSAVRIYYKMIKYESGLNLQEREGQVWCGDSLVERYTFRTNWYFMGGDNMWNSQDSRYLGPIPEEFIIGKATLILTAKDPETKAYRWRRFFTRIRKEVKNR